jgi:hypothetical protein
MPLLPVTDDKGHSSDYLHGKCAKHRDLDGRKSVYGARRSHEGYVCFYALQSSKMIAEVQQGIPYDQQCGEAVKCS